ncbi:MAG TPA: tripartite tricarboxylate transporter substrate binding protein [Ramlibacter sp.]|nr:tripartite tricarboxylate transporter substrate binding protein [Ramlibacter sp.]
MKRILRSAIVLVALASSAAWGQYPSGPIRFVVPFPAGGSTDIVARAIALPMSQSLGQPVVIDNKPGADGLIAGQIVAQSAPDGYTFLFATATSMSFAPATRKSMPYNALTDFTPIGRIGTFGFFVYVHESLPARNMADLVAHARSNPGKLSYGSSSATSVVAAAQFTQGSKLEMVHVPYKGDAPLIADAVTGRVHLMFASGAALPQVSDGKLRVLATLLPNRSPLLPEVPTLTEAGMAKVSITPWAGLFGPAKVPPEIVDRISRELTRALARQDVRAQLGRLAFEGQSSTPEELASLVKEQLLVWRKACEDAGVQAE